MKRPLFIARHAAAAQGILGWCLAHVMAHETLPDNRSAVARARIRPGERVLDVGCGHGRSLRDVVAAADGVTAAGADPSATMLKVARRRNRDLIARGLVTLHHADVSQLPFPRATFDKALSIHTVYFWPDLEAGFRELARVVRPDGLVVVGFRFDPDAAGSFPPEVYTFRSPDQLIHAASASGLAVESIREQRDRSRTMWWLTAARLPDIP